MKKGFKYYGIIWLICVIVFNAIVLAIPSEIAGISKYSGSFWVGYVFVMLAFIGQAACSYTFFSSKDKNSYFLNLPIVTISYSGLIVSVIVGTICMAIPVIPAWIGAIVCVIIFASYAIAVIKAKAAGDAVASIDKKIKVQTFFIKSLTVDLETLAAKAKNENIKAAIKKLYETCRYSDPMSNDALSGVESQITIKFRSLEEAVDANNINDVKNICEEMDILFDDRNKKCKLLKRGDNGGIS